MFPKTCCGEGDRFILTLVAIMSRAEGLLYANNCIYALLNYDC